MELKPCPFCGRSPMVIVEDGCHYVACECGAMMLDGLSQMFDTAAEAIEAWNRRLNDG